jgi:hypothetical protein
MTSLVVRKEIRGEISVVRLERVHVICPACGQQVEAVARDGQVKGYCAVTKQYVDFPIEVKRAVETAPGTPIREGRDSRGHFVKGNVPWNKRGQSDSVSSA